MEDACILLKILTSEMSNKTVIKCKKYTTGKEEKVPFIRIEESHGSLSYILFKLQGIAKDVNTY